MLDLFICHFILSFSILIKIGLHDSNEFYPAMGLGLYITLNFGAEFAQQYDYGFYDSLIIATAQKTNWFINY